uniref:Uncharacterized protein n=1 Tax=Rhizophora mucronata TaxID=61149 RepID=A0A2P2J512_RHIMU
MPINNCTILLYFISFFTPLSL